MRLHSSEAFPASSLTVAAPAAGMTSGAVVKTARMADGAVGSPTLGGGCYGASAHDHSGDLSLCGPCLCRMDGMTGIVA
jgi:hypothetical protein